MSYILQIDSSILRVDSVSRTLSNYMVEQLSNDASKTVKRDVLALPHFTDQHIQSLSDTGQTDREQTKADIKLSDDLINEIKSASAIVIGVPMYNFGIPSQLKSYFDFICRAGVTFKYTDHGPIGLVDNKPVYIICTRGGIYHGTGHDFITPFIEQLLNFIGLRNLHFVYAEALNMGNEAEKKATIEKAKDDIEKILGSGDSQSAA